MKEFSLYGLYNQEKGKLFQNRRETPDSCFQKLVEKADAKLDEVITSYDKDGMLTRDVLVPALCYDLLVDNCKMRKLATQYQMRVLLIHKGKNLQDDPEKNIPDSESLAKA